MYYRRHENISFACKLYKDWHIIMSERKCIIQDMKIFLSLANCIKTGILI